MLDIPTDIVWTPERIELLKQLQAQGLSARDIMIELRDIRITRNSVIGKLKRLGLRCESRDQPKGDKRAPRGSKSKPIMDRRIEIPAKPRPEYAPAVSVPFEPRRSEPKLPTIIDDQEGSQEYRCTLFELTDELGQDLGRCRWPLGPMQSHVEFFCGATGADIHSGCPYCPKHMRKASSRSVAA